MKMGKEEQDLELTMPLKWQFWKPEAPPITLNTSFLDSAFPYVVGGKQPLSEVYRQYNGISSQTIKSF